MDFVSRLKTYMESVNMTSSQFADTCRIPRPSFSQLLNGRNKKVSDEIISKIHDSFPELSVLWLLFGEGSMISDINKRLSEAQNNIFREVKSPQQMENQRLTNTGSTLDNVLDFSSDNFSHYSEKKYNNNAPSLQTPASISSQIPPLQSSTSTNKDIKIHTATNKRITNIVVFYDDNSFESFNPS